MASVDEGKPAMDRSIVDNCLFNMKRRSDGRLGFFEAAQVEQSFHRSLLSAEF